MRAAYHLDARHVACIYLHYANLPHQTLNIHPHIHTHTHTKSRAVLSLDDDILLPCSDVEAAFATWRAAPHQLVGWYPRLLVPEEGSWGSTADLPPVYRFEEFVFEQVRCVGMRWNGAGEGALFSQPAPLPLSSPPPAPTPLVPPLPTNNQRAYHCRALTTLSLLAPPLWTPPPSFPPTPRRRLAPEGSWWMKCSTAMICSSTLWQPT